MQILELFSKPPEKFRRRVILAGLVLPATLALSACRESEQGRPLVLEPGVYKGLQDEQLSAEKREELRQRAGLMRF